MIADVDGTAQKEEVDFGEVFDVTAPDLAPSVLIVCEHASNRIPERLGRLGLSEEVVQSHVAWDPGALGVARSLSRQLSAVLVSGAISRLVYDCNRPPEAATAIPERSEIYDIPGNIDLSPHERLSRVKGVFEPFSKAVADQILRYRRTVRLMVTVHSFTPVFEGVRRSVELGILHGRDDRFARSMMRNTPRSRHYDIRLNEPYAVSDEVAHTVDTHGVTNGLYSVMIEVRNDLIRDPQEQSGMAVCLASWIRAAFAPLASAGEPR